MSSYKNFQSDNFKHDKSQTDIYNPAFNNNVKMNEVEFNSFEKNLEKWSDFISWSKWFPDLWYDLITPETGGIRLDLDQRVMLRCLSRFFSNYGVFPRGYGKCVSGDALLFTEDGVKEIGEYFNYSTIGKEFWIKNSIKLINRDGLLEDTNGGVYSGYLPTIKIMTEEGYEIEGTYNHPILVISEQGKIIWKKIIDIKDNDYVLINRVNNVWGNKTKLNYDMNNFLKSLTNCQKGQILINTCELTDELTDNFALILGYLIGDGCLTRDNTILFTNKDNDIVNNYISFMENTFKVKIKQKDEINYEIYSKYLRQFFKEIGLKNNNAFSKEIPKCILEAPKSIVASFLRGIFDTDGGLSNSYIEYCTASEKLSKQVQTLLLNFGIISTRRKKYNKKFKSYSYCITIYSNNMDLYLKNIGFSCKRKQDKLIELCNKKRNPNKDIIPYQKELVLKYFNDVKKYNPYLYDNIYHILKGKNQLTYNKLGILLSLNNCHDCNGYNELLEFNNKHYFYSKVKNIEKRYNHVYDLSVPKTHSFISNGFISHNTMIEVMGLYHTAIFHPDIELSMTAQTKENASDVLEDKHREILRFYPLMKNEIVKSSFTDNDAEIIFTSGARIDILANQQSSKGQRRKRLNIEESALLNNELFKDVLEPIPNVPRRTIGKEALINPEELNGAINFFTTSGYKGTDEFIRSKNMVKEMANLKGKMVLGADWQLAVHYGRGETKSQILAKKDDPTTSAISFAQNYESKWVGTGDGGLVDIGDVIKLRTLTKPELKPDKNAEYVVAMDVSRSQSQSNNKSAISVLKLIKNNQGLVKQVHLVNIIVPPNGTNFYDQALILKKTAKHYKAIVSVIDALNVGQGVIDNCLKDLIDPETNEVYESWDTINSEHKPDNPDAPKMIFCITAAAVNTDVIVNFMDYIEHAKLRLLTNSKEVIVKEDNFDIIIPHVQTDKLIEEVANLKLVTQKSGGKLSVEKTVRKIDKDRWSATSYGLYWIKLYNDELAQNLSSNDEDWNIFRYR